jgi:hypothetical protein
MRLQWTLGTALLLATLAVAGQSLAAGNESGRLAAFAARQDLCDMICYAKASGHISEGTRFLILNEAKSVLSHDEFLTFKQTLDRVAPPPKAKPKHKHVAKTTYQKKSAPTAKGPELVIPASAILPDGVAQPVFLR